MKFITEANLRDLFKKEPFTSYKTEVDEKLTPGGRQFLIDRGINIIDGKLWGKEETNKLKKEPAILEIKDDMEIKDTLNQRKFYTRMKSIEALFLVTAEEILNRDPFLAQRVIELGKEFSNIKNNLEKEDAKRFTCKECTNIKKDNISDDLDDCFEITGFHIQLEKGRDIIILHRLRCSLREIEPFAFELFQKDNEPLYRGVIGEVNQSINTLSQMICNVVGGEACQKNN